MDLSPWLTPALLVALFAWLRLDLRELRRKLSDRLEVVRKGVDARLDKVDARFDAIDARFDAVNARFDEVNMRFDGVNRELADLRERMAKLEGSLDGFLAGRRDRDAA